MFQRVHAARYIGIGPSIRFLPATILPRRKLLSHCFIILQHQTPTICRIIFLSLSLSKNNIRWTIVYIISTRPTFRAGERNFLVPMFVIFMEQSRSELDYLQVIYQSRPTWCIMHYARAASGGSVTWVSWKIGWVKREREFCQGFDSEL